MISPLSLALQRVPQDKAAFEPWKWRSWHLESKFKHWPIHIWSFQDHSWSGYPCKIFHHPSLFGWLVVWNIFLHNIWDNPSHWLILFRGVETTNQEWDHHMPRCSNILPIPGADLIVLNGGMGHGFHVIYGHRRSAVGKTMPWDIHPWLGL